MNETTAKPRERTPGAKFLLAGLIALLLAIPLFSVYLLVYDRQSQSETARNSIAEGWGGAQAIAGPFLAIPYLDQATETVTEGGKPVTRSRDIWRELVLSPDMVEIDTRLSPERRKRSIYEAVVYEAAVKGRARFSLPADLSRYGVTLERLALERAELRFGLSDARGLFGTPPQVGAGGAALTLQPGKGPSETNGSGFYAPLDATPLGSGALASDFAYAMRGNGSLTLAPQAGDTRWTVVSPWPHPSFQGGFLPVARQVDEKGFSATYRLGNLALGKALVELRDPVQAGAGAAGSRVMEQGGPGLDDYKARITLVQPVDLYSQVNRAVKYGFLFIGFTFLTFLMFDVIGGVRVASVEYLLVGVGLVLFFVLLLAFAEVIGFTAAYLLASAAIIGQIAAYSAAVLKSWRRAIWVGGLLTALYAVLYILLSLEAYSLLIGSVMLFLALGAVMYLTRRVDWGGKRLTASADSPG
jgi:inner membrane protein